MPELKTIAPSRLDRLDVNWIHWFIQTQQAAAATILAQAASSRAQLAQAGMMAPNMLSQINTQIQMMEEQARVHLSVLVLCEEVKSGPYFTREKLDEAVKTAIKKISHSDRTDDQKAAAKSGVWELCKVLGIPMGELQ